MTLAHDRRLQLLAVAALLPALLLALGLLRLAPLPWFLKLALGIAVLLPPFFVLKRLRLLAQRPLQTLSNILAAIREGDYSFRARTNRGDDPLATVFQELNSLSELLQQQRMKAIENAEDIVKRYEAGKTAPQPAKEPAREAPATPVTITA